MGVKSPTHGRQVGNPTNQQPQSTGIEHHAAERARTPLCVRPTPKQGHTVTQIGIIDNRAKRGGSGGVGGWVND